MVCLGRLLAILLHTLFSSRSGLGSNLRFEFGFFCGVLVFGNREREWEGKGGWKERNTTGVTASSLLEH